MSVQTTRSGLLGLLVVLTTGCGGDLPAAASRLAGGRQAAPERFAPGGDVGAVPEPDAGAAPDAGVGGPAAPPWKPTAGPARSGAPAPAPGGTSISAAVSSFGVPPADPPPEVEPVPADAGSPHPAKAAKVRFTEVAAEVGISHVQGPETDETPACGDLSIAGCDLELTGGVAVGDYDGDGWQDLYFTRIDGPGVLYRNRGGTFEDVTEAAGLAIGSSTNGAAFGDLDGNGTLDLYVTSMLGARHYLFINDGHGRFTEQGRPRGAALDDGRIKHGMGVSLGDYDRDGYLDVHAAEYRVLLGVASPPQSHNVLLHNLGVGGTGWFEDVTVRAGVSMDANTGGPWAFGATFSDLDDDGWPDLGVVADLNTSRLFWNRGDGRFVDGTISAGVGTDLTGMGSAIGDYDGDGLLDWFVTAIDGRKVPRAEPLDGNRLYHNEGDRTFSDETDLAGVRDGAWNWGAEFFDPDNDGDLDIVMASGMEPDQRKDSPFASGRLLFFRHDVPRSQRLVGGEPVYREVANSVGLDGDGLGRGVAILDMDNDGDQDVVVARRAATPLVYRNELGNSLGFLRVRLHGTRSPTEGIGAKVTVRLADGSAPMVREIHVGGYLGQRETIAHFGLGEGTAPVAEVRVRWPRDGAEQVLTGVERNRLIDVTEP